MKEPYSDRRWREAPVGINSACGTCGHYYGYDKCKRYPEKIPKAIIDRSFPGMDGYRENYCEYRKEI